MSTGLFVVFFFFVKQKTAYELRISDWSSDVCSSDLQALSIPPTRKYQSDTGPGIIEIMGLLNGSDSPQVDRIQFMRANIVFWLLGAIDGHAKNFSLHLHPAGRFNMTPLYDVISAQPSADEIGRESGRERVGQYVRIAV